MTKKEIRAHIATEAKKYNANEWELFIAEYGWSDWMNEYTNEPDGEPATESETAEITRILREVWDEVHASYIDDYGNLQHR